MLLPLVLLVSGESLGQPSADPQQLQKEAIAKIDHWVDYVRRTGDANGTVAELSVAQVSLSRALICSRSARTLPAPH
jgi:hypothetical protein